MCFFTVKGMNNLQRFLQNLNCSFGSGGLNAWFQSKQLPELLHQPNTAQKLQVKKAARIVGRQPESNTWVLSPDLQVSWLVISAGMQHTVCYRSVGTER